MANSKPLDDDVIFEHIFEHLWFQVTNHKRFSSEASSSGLEKAKINAIVKL